MIYLKSRVIYRKGETQIFHFLGSLLKWLQQLGLDHAGAMNQELLLGLPYDGQVPKHLGHLLLSKVHLAGS